MANMPVYGGGMPYNDWLALQNEYIRRGYIWTGSKWAVPVEAAPGAKEVDEYGTNVGKIFAETKPDEYVKAVELTKQMQTTALTDPNIKVPIYTPQSGLQLSGGGGVTTTLGSGGVSNPNEAPLKNWPTKIIMPYPDEINVELPPPVELPITDQDKPLTPIDNTPFSGGNGIKLGDTQITVASPPPISADPYGVIDSGTTKKIVEAPVAKNITVYVWIGIGLLLFFYIFTAKK